MFRFIVVLLCSVFLITIIRSVIGVILKGFAELIDPARSQQSPQPSAASIQVSGELKRDPVCGVYISTATSVKKTVSGQTLHFCSAECRDKHRV